jgi:hypothetical protein
MTNYFARSNSAGLESRLSCAHPNQFLIRAAHRSEKLREFHLNPLLRLRSTDSVSRITVALELLQDRLKTAMESETRPSPADWAKLLPLAIQHRPSVNLSNLSRYLQAFKKILFRSRESFRQWLSHKAAL